MKLCRLNLGNFRNVARAAVDLPARRIFLRSSRLRCFTSEGYGRTMDYTDYMDRLDLTG